MPAVRLLDFKTPYVKTDAVDANRRSALSLISQLLRLAEVTDKHLAEQLSLGLWKWTESAGVAPYPKFNLRYVSDGVWNAADPTIRINHEHVWTRRSLIKTLRSKSWTDDELDAFLTQYGVACVVTVQEHGQLGGSRSEGWQRYLDLGIPVWDRESGKLADFTELLGGPSDITPAEQPDGVDDAVIGPADVEEQVVGLGRIDEETSGSAEVADLLDTYAKPALSGLLRQLMRIADLATAVSVVSLRRGGEPSGYFRIHDALIGEPTAAVAYPHWNGRVAFRLVAEDLPTALKVDPRVQHLQKRHYAVQVRIADSGTVEFAGELLLLALEKLRDRQ